MSEEARKFYQKTVTIVILSETPIGEPDLGQIHHQVIEGDWSGKWEHGEEKVLNGKEAAEALKSQDSDPSFFGLNDDGTDIVQ